MDSRSECNHSFINTIFFPADRSINNTSILRSFFLEKLSALMYAESLSLLFSPQVSTIIFVFFFKFSKCILERIDRSQGSLPARHRDLNSAELRRIRSLIENKRKTPLVFPLPLIFFCSFSLTFPLPYRLFV